MITVVTRPVTACVTACNRTTTAEQLHMHKEKKTTFETLLGHRLTTSSTVECGGGCLVPNPSGTCWEPEAMASIKPKCKAANM